MEGNGTRIFWGGDAALWEESDATPVSGKGSSPPSLLGWRFYAESRGETEAWGAGHYSAHVLSMPRFPCQPWLVLSVCPSPWHVPHPDSHPHGHGQLSTSFQAGAGISTGGERGNRVPHGRAPRRGWSTPLPNPSLSGPQAAKPLSVPPGDCPPSLRPPSSAHGCPLIPPRLPSRDHPGDSAGDGGSASRRRTRRRPEEG